MIRKLVLEPVSSILVGSFLFVFASDWTYSLLIGNLSKVGKYVSPQTTFI